MMKTQSMKRNPNGILYLVIAGFMVLGTACQSGSNRTSDALENLEALNPTGDLESFSQIYHLYPSPAEMLDIIDMEEMDFNESLLHPPGQSDRYLDTKSKTYILGLYMTDLAYTALFGRHEATLDYLEAVRALSGEIRIDQAVDDAMVAKAERNVEYLDSLYSISNDAFMNMIAFCERNDRSNTVVMLSAGAFVESLFLGVHLIDDYATADRLLQHLADQKYTIDNFMAFAESVGDGDPNVTATIKDLRTIEKIYQGIDPGTGEVTVSTETTEDEERPKKLVIGSGGPTSQPSLTEEEFLSLKNAVIELRTKIVEGS